MNIADRSQAFLSKGGDASYLKVKLPNDIASIAASVAVTLDDGSKLVRPFVSGEGLGSDQSHIITFGLGDQRATSVDVTYINGATDERSGEFRNQVVTFSR